MKPMEWVEKNQFDCDSYSCNFWKCFFRPCGNKTCSSTSKRRLLNMKLGSHQKVKDYTIHWLRQNRKSIYLTLLHYNKASRRSIVRAACAPQMTYNWPTNKPARPIFAQKMLGKNVISAFFHFLSICFCKNQHFSLSELCSPMSGTWCAPICVPTHFLLW